MLVVVTVLGVAGAYGGAYGYLLYAGDREIDRVEVAALRAPGDSDGDGRVDIPEITEIRNILVVGTDSREDGNAKLGPGDFEGKRTDTIMLVQLDPRRDIAAILSLPRDLYIPLCTGGTDKINAAYTYGETSGEGGPNCLVDTITELTGIGINHYVEIDFRGFVDVVDRLGGVQLYLDEPISDSKAQLSLEAGCVTLDGRDALGFVRTRQDSDFGRIARQQRFVTEVVEKLTSARIAFDLPRLFSLVSAGAQAVDTDRDFRLDEMRRLAFSLRGLTSDRVEARQVPVYDGDVGGVYVALPDEARAEELYAAFRAGVALPDDIGKPARLTVADVSPLVVLNATTTTGLASAASSALSDQGFDVTTTDDADRQDLQRTQVRFPEELRGEARVVADSLGGARLVADDGAAALEVVLGDDADPAELAAASAGTPTPQSPAGASEPPPARRQPLPVDEAEQQFAGASASRDC